MPDCNDTLRELESFLDSELSSSARDEIHAHLGDCPHCLEAFDFHAELRLVIAQKCQNDEMPHDLLSKIEMCFNEDFDGDGVIG